MKKNCLICNIEFEAYRAQKYCSDKCNDKSYRIRNKEKEQARHKKYNAANKDKKKEYDNKYRETNIDLIRAKDRTRSERDKTKRKASSKKHYQENKSAYFAKDTKRREMNVQATLKGYDQELTEVFKNRPDGYHADHIVPVNNPKVCGLNVAWNFQYLTASDNLKKSNKFDGTNENESWRTE